MAQDGGDGRASMRRLVTRLNNIPDPHVDMDSIVDSREERRLMRQRGAGNREFNSIDFGFAFATPVQLSTRNLRTRSRTPSVPARTPIRGNDNEKRILSSTARSVRTPRLPAIIAQDPKSSVVGQAQRKRRHLSDISNISRSTSQGLPAAHEVADPKDADGNQFHDVAPALEGTHEQLYEIDRHNPASSPLFFPDQQLENFDANKENEPAKHAKKRKRKSIGQQSLFKKKKRPSEISTASSYPTPLIEASIEQQKERLDTGHQDSTPAEGVVASSGSADNGSGLPHVPPTATQADRTLPSSTARVPTRRKKRKSVTGVKAKRKTSDGTPSFVRNSPFVTEHLHGQDIMGNTDYMHDSDTSIAQRPSTRQNILFQQSPLMSPAKPAETPRLDVRDEEDADQTYVPDEATPEPTPAPNRAKVKVPVRRRPSSAGGTRSNISNRKQDKFPILTHRMANISALPTIIEGVALNLSREDNDDEIDELAGNPPAIMSKSAPNAVDVLAQACRETIDAAVEDLKDLSSADRKRQTVALQTFRSNLDMRLFDLSQSLDQRLHLEARLRRQRREKAELQGQWLEIRKQRDVMALRMDAARRQHWDNENMNREAWQISQTAHQLETAMSRAETQPDQDSQAGLLEFSLEELSQDVSSKDGGGILNVLRDFNAHLERTAKISG